jgi:hypothetical protein
MNSSSLEKVSAAQFLGAQLEAVQLARPELHSSVQLSIAILKTLTDGQWRTAEEICRKLNINGTSARQILNTRALESH